MYICEKKYLVNDFFNGYKKNNKKVTFSKIALLLIIVSVIFMCIGYASINSISMNITGDVSAQV